MSDEIQNSELKKSVTLKLVVVGDKMVGKTSIINRYFHNKFSNKHIEEIWLKVTNKKIKLTLNDNNDVLVNFFVYDLASEETFEEYFKPFSEGTNGILIVFDLSRINTFESVDDWIRKLKAISTDKVIQNSVLIGAKSDLRELRELNSEKGIDKANELNLIQYIETSAKNDEQIAEVFEILARNCLLNN